MQAAINAPMPGTAPDNANADTARAMPGAPQFFPLHSRADYGTFRPLTMADAETSLWHSMRAAFSQAWEMSPTQSYLDTAEIRGDQYFADAYSSTVSDADIVNAIADGKGTPWDLPEAMPLEAQRRKIEEAGLGGILEPDARDNERGLELKIARKRTERSRAALAEAAPGWHAPFSLAAGFAGGMIDPVNIASCFVPVIGEERMLAMLGQAGSAWARAGVRARIGAASGAVGAGLVEPVVYGNQMELGADYGMAHSLMNVSAGAVLGAALGPVAGHVGEWWRNKKGMEQPWTFAPETDETRRLMQDHARQMTEAMWHTDLTPEQRMASAMDAARAYDLFARKTARANGQSVADVYAAYRIDYQAGEWRLVDRRAPFMAGPDDFFGGMERHWEELDAELPIRPGEVDSFYSGMEREWDAITAREAAARAPIDPGELDGFYGNMQRALTESGEGSGGQRPLAVVDFDPQAAGDDVLYMAKYISPAKSFEDFRKRMDERRARGDKGIAQFDYGVTITRADGNANSHRIFVGEDQVVHVEKKRPDFDGWNEIPRVIQTGNVIEGRYNTNFNGPTKIFYTIDDGMVLGVAVVDVSSKRFGNVFLLQTAYRERVNVFAGYLKSQKKPLPSDVLAALQHTQALHKGRDVPITSSSGEGSLQHSGNVVKPETEMPLPHAASAAPRRPQASPFDEVANYAFSNGETSLQRNMNVVKPETEMPLPDAMLAAVQHAQALRNAEGRSRNVGSGEGKLTQTGEEVNAAGGKSAGAAKDIGTLNQLGADAMPLAQAQFFEEARAMVTFFRAADIDSAPHEVFHIIRRRLGEEAKQPGSPLAKEYAALEKSFGVVNGHWTRAQEESFAESMLSILKHETRPAPAAAGIAAAFRTQLFELYCEADASGLPMTPAMRQLFNGIMTTSPEEGRRLLMEQIADLSTRRWEQALIDPSLSTDAPAAFMPDAFHPDSLRPARPASQGSGQPGAAGAAPSPDALQQSLADLRRQTDAFLASGPEETRALREQIRADRDAALMDLERELMNLPEQQKLMEDIMLCYYNG